MSGEHAAQRDWHDDGTFSIDCACGWGTVARTRAGAVQGWVEHVGAARGEVQV